MLGARVLIGEFITLAAFSLGTKGLGQACRVRRCRMSQNVAVEPMSAGTLVKSAQCKYSFA